MAKLPSFRRIYEQDFDKDSQELVRQLSVTINAGFEVLYEVLNGKLTFKDNIASTIKELDIQVDASGKPLSNASFKKSSSDRIEGLMVIRADNLSSSNTYPTTGVFVSFTETSDNIIINNITGLQANAVYRIKLLTIR